MIEAKPYPEEVKRLESLRALKILDTPIEERFERLTRMVCRALDVPIALFNLIDENRQHYKSVQGLTNTDASLDAAFCTHAIHEDMLLVPDTSRDTRFFDNPFVTGERLNIGFYAVRDRHQTARLNGRTACHAARSRRDAGNGIEAYAPLKIASEPDRGIAGRQSSRDGRSAHAALEPERNHQSFRQRVERGGAAAKACDAGHDRYRPFQENQ
jgi:hypothetical protein